MKKVMIEIFVGETTTYRERMEDLTADEVRRVIAMLEEIKSDLVDKLRENRHFVDIKKEGEKECEIIN